MLKYHLYCNTVLLIVLTACIKTITIDDVQVIKKIAQPNQFCQYQYLVIPDSASEEELLSITTKIQERDERSTKVTVYNYYLKSNRNTPYAILNGFLWWVTSY